MPAKNKAQQRALWRAAYHERKKKGKPKSDEGRLDLLIRKYENRANILKALKAVFKGELS